MWRLIPLLKMTLRMTIFGVILGLALGLFTIVVFGSTFLAPKSFYYQQAVQGEVINGAILGALSGIALAVYAGIAHRTIHKPHLFKFTFLIVATIAAFAVVQKPFHIAMIADLGISGLPLAEWLPWALTNPVVGPIFIATIAKHVAVGLMSLYVAERYLRDTSSQVMKSTGKRSHNRAASVGPPALSSAPAAGGLLAAGDTDDGG